MPRANENKLYRSFVKGLLTEASYLTYPENASFDELNTVLSRKGNRARRLGIDYADQIVEGSITPSSTTDARNEYVWKAVANKANLSFFVHQVGTQVFFYDLAISPISSGKLLFSINLASYLRPGASSDSLRDTVTYFASGRGYLFIVNENIEPLAVSYKELGQVFTVTPLTILVRDYDGLFDGLANDEEPSVLTKEHHYNLQNQGWVTTSQSSTVFSPVTLNGYTYGSEFYYPDIYGYQYQPAYQGSTGSNPIFVYQSKIGRFPGNNKQWWVARAEADDDTKGVKAGDFLPDVLNKLYSGNNRSPRGHYILNAFRKDRASVSGVSSIPVEDLETRPNAVAFFSGRAWFAAGATVYYSQILDGTSVNKAGLCYQEADPTAEDISDLIASDGGVVPIPEADKIERILPLSNGIVVFAQNGVWFISGGDSAFSATNISVSKISPIGTNSPLSIIETDGTIFWWSEVGINALQQASGQFGPIPNQFGNTNIAEQTIQSFYNEIDTEVFPYVKACYDTRNNVVYWLYRDTDLSKPFTYNRVLLYDLTLQAFYPWKFSSIVDGPEIVGIFLDIGLLTNSELDILTDVGVSVTDNDVQVTTEEFTTDIRPSNINFVTDVGGLTFSQAENVTFSDWKTFDGQGLPYDSYVATGFELNEDTMRRKQIVYLFAHFRRTEDEFGDNPSSCSFQARWDWSNSRNSNKWTTEIEAYRPRKWPDATLADHLTGFDVVTSKNKVRGSGKSVQFRFGTSDIGKNFDLLGWSVAFVGNTQP